MPLITSMYGSLRDLAGEPVDTPHALVLALPGAPVARTPRTAGDFAIATGLAVVGLLGVGAESRSRATTTTRPRRPRHRRIGRGAGAPDPRHAPDPGSVSTPNAVPIVPTLPGGTRDGDPPRRDATVFQGTTTFEPFQGTTCPPPRCPPSRSRGRRRHRDRPRDGHDPAGLSPRPARPPSSPPFPPPLPPPAPAPFPPPVHPRRRRCGTSPGLGFLSWARWRRHDHDGALGELGRKFGMKCGWSSAAPSRAAPCAGARPPCSRARSAPAVPP